MKKRILLLVIISCCFAHLTSAQFVTTFANTPSNGDVAVDKNGNVYTVSENTVVVKTSPDGQVDPNPFASGANFSRATGLSFDRSGEILYVTNRPLNGQGWITKVEPDGTSEIIASNLFFPGDITFDEAGNMYVTHFNNIIRKITPSGVVSAYAASTLFNTALGIAWTPGDIIFVASAHDGNIYKLTPTNPVQVDFFAHVDGLVQNWACGFMTYGQGKLFITNGDNKIHSIDINTGVVEGFAGTGNPGNNDGPWDEAEFWAPNGIGFNTDFSKFYVSEYGRGRIREVNGLDLLKIKDEQIHTFKVYPNPFNEIVNFEFNLTNADEVSVAIYDMKGSLIKRLEKKFTSAGKQSITWHVDDSKISSGIYYGVITAGNSVQNVKIIHQEK